MEQRLVKLCFFSCFVLCAALQGRDTAGTVPRPRPVFVSLGYDASVLESYLWDNDSHEKEIVIFKMAASETSSTSDSHETYVSSSSRIRTSPTSKKGVIASAPKHEMKQRDPSNILFRTHGFSYIGKFSSHLPDFCIIERNKTFERQGTDNYQEHLRNAYSAVWISPMSDKKQYAARSVEFPRASPSAKANYQKKSAQDKVSRAVLFKQARHSALRKAMLRNIDPYGVSHKMAVASSRDAIKDRSSTFGFEGFRDRNRRLLATQQGLPSDPMTFLQWHLHGGMFNTLLGHPTDRGRLTNLNVYPVWESQGVDGDRAIIAIVDDGVNFAHSDLSDKFVQALSVDMAGPAYVNHGNWSRPGREYNRARGTLETDKEYDHRMMNQVREHTKHGFPLVSQSHGTSVASLAAGSPNDGTCGTGIAPGAKLSSIRIIKETIDGEVHQLLTELQQAMSMSYKCISEYSEQILFSPPNIPGEPTQELGPASRLENQIFLLGWGPVPNDTYAPIQPSPLVQAAVQTCIEYGRQGKGTIYVVPAGNERLKMSTMDIDGYVNMRYFISVGGISSKGYPVSYAEGGESLLVSAPCGDHSLGLVTSMTQGSFYATRTTDMSSGEAEGDKGLARAGLSSTGCTSSFKGTSASAALVAGISALIVDANPSVTWKDTMDIMIRSCSKPHFDSYVPYIHAFREHILFDLQIKAKQEGKLVTLRTQEDQENMQRVESQASISTKEEKGHSILEEAQRNMYIFYDPVDGEHFEWSPNHETGLHHSYYIGFGVPDAFKAVQASKAITPSTSIRNDYIISTGNLAHQRIFYYVDAEKKDEYLEKLRLGEYYTERGNINQNEIAVWHINLDTQVHRALKVYDGREGTRSTRPSDFVIEQVQVYVNATIPRGTSMAQLAICGRGGICSLPMRGMAYDSVSHTMERLSYSFKTVKHWGQRNPYQGAWYIMMRNVFPLRAPPIVVHEISLNIYGHYVDA